MPEPAENLEDAGTETIANNDDLEQALNAAWDDAPEGDGDELDGVDAGDATPSAAPDGDVSAPEGRGTEPAPMGDDASAQAGTAPQDGPVAPEHWSAEDKATFGKQTPEARNWLMNRHKAMEADYTRKSQEVAPMRQAAAQWEPYLRQLNTSPAQALDSFLRADQALRSGTPEQKRAELLQIANDYGIQLGPVAAPEGAPAPTDTDLIGQAVQSHLSPVVGQVEQMRSYLANQAAAQQDQQATTIAGKIVQFRDAKTEAGTLAHPLFNDVYDDMVRMAHSERASGRMPELSDLYDRAVWSNPTTREQAIVQRQTDAAANTKAARAQRVAAARRAGTSITEGTGGVSAPESEHEQSLDETLAQAFDRYG